MKDNMMDRRQAIISIGATAAAFGTAPLVRSSASAPKPNIVFILTDDHRFDALGFMGKPWLKTPNMDRLAKEGVHFANSFVTTSLCSPSRASFLTGQYAHCHGVMNNATPWNEQNTTFLEILHAHGFRTGFIGKWHMPGKGIPDLVGQGKIDRMVSFSYATGQGVYFDCPLIIDGKPQESKGYITDLLTDYALDFLAADSKKPFCLFLSHKAVHAMFHPPKRYEGKLNGAPLPELQPSEKDLPLGLINGWQRLNFDKNVQGYYEALMAVDDSVGKILQYLDDKNLAENTLVVYTSDNGYFWGEHNLTDKRYPYEESIRVPHLLRYPRAIPQGGRLVEEMVLNIDLFPTLLEAAGINQPTLAQGKSYLSLAKGKKENLRDAFLYEYFQDPMFPVPAIKAIRTDEWKLITYPSDPKKFPDELYNLKKDPQELNDLADVPRFAEKKKALKKRLERLEIETACG